MKKLDKLYRKSLEAFCFFSEKRGNSEQILWQISNHSSLSIFILFSCGDRKITKMGGDKWVIETETVNTHKPRNTEFCLFYITYEKITSKRLWSVSAYAKNIIYYNK